MLSLIIITLYLVGTILFWRRIKGFNQSIPASGVDRPKSRWGYILIAAVTTLLHGWQLTQAMSGQNNLNLALGYIISLVCLMTMVTYSIGTLFRRITNLGIFVLPIGLTGFLIGRFFPGASLVLEQAPTALWIHLTIAIMAFSFLCIATVQAGLLLVQSRQLQSPRPGSLFPALPSIQTMETNMVQLSLAGVVLLTVNLATGLLTSWQVHGRTIEFNHHILLSILAWLTFSGLLIGRRRFGWRGEIAAKWTFFGFSLLLLAYFGTRVVTSIILA